VAKVKHRNTHKILSIPASDNKKKTIFCSICSVHSRAFFSLSQQQPSRDVDGLEKARAARGDKFSGKGRSFDKMSRRPLARDGGALVQVGT